MIASIIAEVVLRNGTVITFATSYQTSMLGDLLHYEVIDSTHLLLQRMLQAGEPVCGRAVSAGFQTGGRGQGSNQWHSLADQNILLSFCHCPDDFPATRQFDISVAAALALLGLTDSLQIPETSVKWPNDIWSGKLKLAGMLVSHTVSGYFIRHSIISVGLNVNQTVFPVDLPNPVSLRVLTGNIFDKVLLTEQLLDLLRHQLKRVAAGESSVMRTEYLKRLFGLGQWHRFSIHGTPTECQIKGVDVFGRLQLLHPEGSLQSYDLSEAKLLQ